MNYTTVLYHLW